MYHGVFINAEVRSNLIWPAFTIPHSIGVKFVNYGHWLDLEANLVMWTDASLKLGLSFVYNNNRFVYQLCKCPSNIKIDIFFLELVAIMSAIHHVASFSSPPRRLLIFTDILNSIAIFNSLCTSQSLHTAPLLSIASSMMHTRIDLRVCHIGGKNNIWADLLSCLLLEEFAALFPSIRVPLFDPPCDLLPV
jgi:hypothetical protein